MPARQQNSGNPTKQARKRGTERKRREEDEERRYESAKQRKEEGREQSKITFIPSVSCLVDLFLLHHPLSFFSTAGGVVPLHSCRFFVSCLDPPNVGLGEPNKAHHLPLSLAWLGGRALLSCGTPTHEQRLVGPWAAQER